MHDLTYADFFDYTGNRSTCVRTDFLKQCLTSNQYIRIDGSARNGMIGIADFSRNKRFVTRKQFLAIRRGAGSEKPLHDYIDNIIREVGSFNEYIEHIYHSWDEFELRFDDGSIFKPSSYNPKQGRSFTWLRTYKGPTVKAFTKVPKAIREAELAAFVPTFTDALGKIVEVGDLITVSIGAKMSVGTVTEILKTGRSVRVRSIEKNKETLITDSNKLIVIDEKTKTRAMMKKLSK